MKLSIIIPTKNEEQNIRKIVQSITKNPEYSPENIEIIVVDNTKSSDNTSKIASELKEVRLFAKGPERCAQRNCGAQNSTGDILMFLDADMIINHSRPLDKGERRGILSEILEHYKNPANKNTALVIPERVSGKSIYARARNLEKQIYTYNEVISAARVFPKDIFLKIGGFNEQMTSGEDWELDRRFRKNGGKIAFTKNHIIHNEKDLGFMGSLNKKIYYAKKLINHNVGFQTEVNPFYRIGVLFTKPALIMKNPVTFIYLVTLKLCEFSVGFWVYLVNKL
jgi:glycosyltransferase involved in cell wall biosynthesis